MHFTKMHGLGNDYLYYFGESFFLTDIFLIS